MCTHWTRMIFLPVYVVLYLQVLKDISTANPAPQGHASLLILHKCNPMFWQGDTQSSTIHFSQIYTCESDFRVVHPHPWDTLITKGILLSLKSLLPLKALFSKVTMSCASLPLSGVISNIFIIQFNTFVSLPSLLEPQMDWLIFFFSWLPCSMCSSPGQGSDPSLSSHLSSSHGNTGSLTHCAGPGIEPASHCSHGCTTVGIPWFLFKLCILKFILCMRWAIMWACTNA